MIASVPRSSNDAVRERTSYSPAHSTRTNRSVRTVNRARPETKVDAASATGFRGPHGPPWSGARSAAVAERPNSRSKAVPAREGNQMAIAFGDQL